jgi:hypothetical protein
MRHRLADVSRMAALKTVRFLFNTARLDARALRENL